MQVREDSLFPSCLSWRCPNSPLLSFVALPDLGDSVALKPASTCDGTCFPSVRQTRDSGTWQAGAWTGTHCGQMSRSQPLSKPSVRLGGAARFLSGTPLQTNVWGPLPWVMQRRLLQATEAGWLHQRAVLQLMNTGKQGVFHIPD